MWFFKNQFEYEHVSFTVNHYFFSKVAKKLS